MKGRKILLVNPWIHDFAAYDLWAKPLGLLYIGSVLRRNGCEVSYMDCLRAPHPHMETKAPKITDQGHGKYYRQIIKKPDRLRDIKRNYSRYGISIEAFEHDLLSAVRPDAVLVTSLMTYWYPGVFEAISCIKEVFAGIPVILGGIYATLCTDHARRYSGADYVVAGEGEQQILSLFEELWGNPATWVPDLANLDNLDYPCYDLIDDLKYVCIQTSRGCPFNCTYCASRFLSPCLRRRDPFKVVDEIAWWNRTREVVDFAFYDDALLCQSDTFALPMMKEIVKRRLDIRFHCPNGLHIRSITKEAASFMKECGFSTIRLGLETSDPLRQEMSGGKVVNEDFLRCMENLCEAGFSSTDIGVYILCGLPGQRAQEVLDAVNLVKSVQARPMITEYSPIPHTKDYEDALRTSPYNISQEPLYQNNSFLSCRWEGLTLEDYRRIKNAARAKP
ncbi:MAG TPA: B12-binding domain-containing radical SAM protein [Deltaproteobacteria bacterium]|nr:B12-binding domain-containing radical SAM protein [Deltaproteobacteria bacterium]